jgi:hypothetical protein
MNLSRHAAVLWRFRRVTAVGVLVGIFLAIFASYRIGSGGLTPRGSETWTAISSILVTQPGFPEGRVTLPTTQVDDAVTVEGDPAVSKDAKPDDQVEFADPGRLAALGDLYAKFLTSDEILSKVPEHPSPAQVMASPFAASQSGQLLPVVQLTTMATAPKAARDLNLHTFEALKTFITNRQEANDIGVGKRIELKLIQEPAVQLSSGRKPTASVLVFILVMLGTVAVAHLLEAARNRRQAATLASLDAWQAPSAPAGRTDAVYDEDAELDSFVPSNGGPRSGAGDRRSIR